MEVLNGVPVPAHATVAQLAEMLRGKDVEKWAAMAALARKECDESLGLLRSAAQDRDWHVRRSAIEALGGHARGATAASVVSDALRDPHPPVVRTACDAAARLRLDVAHDAVLGVLRDPDAASRGAALRALEVLGRSSDFGDLWRAHTSDPSDEVRKSAAWVLHRYATADSWRALFDRWIADPLPRHRAWACELAMSFGDERLAPTILPLRSDSDGHVRAAAERALAPWADPD